MDQLLKVIVLSPKQTLFEGLAKSISSSNLSGKFDILPQHASFITFIDNHPIEIIKDNDKKIAFNFPQGIIFVRDNVVKIYTRPQTLIS